MVSRATSEKMKNRWARMSEADRAEISQKISDRLKAYWANKSEEERKRQGAIMGSNIEKRALSIKEAFARRREQESRVEVKTVYEIKAQYEEMYPREEVFVFSKLMEKKLRKRDAYGGWRHLPLDYLAKKLEAEMRELLISLKYESPEEVMSECADVANFVMFIWDIMRSQPDTRKDIVRRGSKDKAHGG